MGSLHSTTVSVGPIDGGFFRTGPRQSRHLWLPARSELSSPV